MIPEQFGSAISQTPLTGGCVSDVELVKTNQGQFVVKTAKGVDLRIEAKMLDDLRKSGVSVPDVLHTDSDTLVMTFIASDGVCGKSGEIHAAETLSKLHTQTGSSFGFSYDTLIGGLHQPNPATNRWITFFGNQRLLEMTTQSIAAGRLPKSYNDRVHRIVDALPDLISEPANPALLHGDIWSGNVLFHQGMLAALIDPAIYWGHPEIELAFIRFFSTFGETFFDAYTATNPIVSGFEERSAVYNLYPTLVHVRLFGGSYVHQLDATLKRFGC